MSIEKELRERSGSKCELCGNTDKLSIFLVPEASSDGTEAHIYVCNICFEQINTLNKLDGNHWRCLNDSMWSSVPAVQVMAYKMLNLLKSQDWVPDLLDIIYLEDNTKAWADKIVEEDNEEKIVHKDSNGNILSAGDSVVLIKDLNVKGGGFTAKRGTAVRNISLDLDNADYIEGKVEGQHIVILTQYVKKSN